MRGGPVHGLCQQRGERLGELASGTNVSTRSTDLRERPPPAVRLVLVRLDLGLPADVDLVDDVAGAGEVGLAGGPSATPSSGATARGQPDRALQRGRVDDQPDLLGRARGPRTEPTSRPPLRTTQVCHCGEPAADLVGVLSERRDVERRVRRRPRTAQQARWRTGELRGVGRLGGAHVQAVGVEGRPTRASRSGRRSAVRAQRCVAAATRRWRRGRRRAAPAAPRGRARRAAWCRRGTRAARPRATPRRATRALPIDAGQQPGDGLDDHQDGDLPPVEDVVAERDHGHRHPGRRRPRPRARRCPRTGRRRRPATARRPARRAIRWVNGSPAGLGTTRCGSLLRTRRTASSASPHGSGRMTMPAPPP